MPVLAENDGFGHALTQVRCAAGYGAAYQHESTGSAWRRCRPPQRLR
jgi:FMNH2-dependent dimethyl sulfone monooxygenase